MNEAIVHIFLFKSKTVIVYTVIEKKKMNVNV